MENKDDNLEKYFHEKFHQDIPPDDWNVPGDDVWDHIESNLPKKKKRRILGFLPFILAGLALLLAILFGVDNYNKSNKIKELQHELEKCENTEIKSEKSIGSTTPLQENKNLNTSTKKLNQEISNNNSEENVLSSSITTNSQGNTQSLNNNNSTNSSTQNFSKNITENKHRTNSNNLLSNVSSPTSNNSIDRLNPTANENTKSAALNDRTKDEKNESILDPSSVSAGSDTKRGVSNGPVQRNISELYKLPSLDAFVISDKIVSPELIKIQPASNIETAENRDKDSIKTSRKYKMWLGPVGGYNIWNDRLSGQYVDPLVELLKKEKTANSVSIGLAFGRQISPKIVLSAALNYYVRKQSSSYGINLPYSTVDEISAGDDFENHFQHSLPTSLGNISTELILARNKNSAVQNNENVGLDLSFDNIMNVISLPITAQFFLKEAGNGFYFQTGIINEYILRHEITDVVTNSHHTFVNDKSISISYNSGQVNRYNMRLLAGIGYQREFYRGFSLAAFANYGYAITNTFQKVNYRHKIDQINFGFGVYKRF